jgi:hypothetical protein
VSSTPAAAHFQVYTEGPEQLLRWRLLSGNNRDMGRGARTYVDLEDVHLGIKETQSILMKLDRVLVRTPGNQWRWLLREGKEDVVVAGRVYDRRIRSEQACLAFVLAASDAVVRNSVAVRAEARGVSRIFR